MEQFPNPKTQGHGEQGDEHLLQRRQKVPPMLNQTSCRPKKTVNAPSADRKKTCAREGQRFAQDEPQKSTDQNAQCVEKCAGHVLTEPLRTPSAKPEIFCVHSPGLLLKYGWPKQKPVPAARGFGFRRFMWRKECRMRCGDVGVAGALQKTSACRTQTSAFYTSWLYLPWVIKPLWSPAVDLLKTGGNGFG